MAPLITEYGGINPMRVAGTLAVVHELSNRRLFQATARVLDAVDDEVAEVRARTGYAPIEPSDWNDLRMDDDLGLGMREVASAAAYQASMRTARAIRQRSLTEFLK